MQHMSLCLLTTWRTKTICLIYCIRHYHLRFIWIFWWQRHKLIHTDHFSSSTEPGVFVCTYVLILWCIDILLLIAAASCSGQNLFMCGKLIGSIKLNMHYSSLHRLCSVSFAQDKILLLWWMAVHSGEKRKFCVYNKYWKKHQKSDWLDFNVRTLEPSASLE